MTDQDRLNELDRQIAEAPGWGAALAVMAEERDAIARRLGIKPIRRVGGIPMAD